MAYSPLKASYHKIKYNALPLTSQVGGSVDEWGSTPLMHACERGDLYGVSEFVKDPNNAHLINFRNPYTGYTALYFAIRSFKPKMTTAKERNLIINILLDNGADPRILTRDRENVLTLLQPDANKPPYVSYVDPESISAIWKKASLLQDHDNVSIKTYFSTPLMYAAEEGDIEKVKSYLKLGVNVNFQNPYNGKTALHYATDPMPNESLRANRTVIANLLLKYGANPFIRSYGELFENAVLLHGLRISEMMNYFGKDRRGEQMGRWVAESWFKTGFRLDFNHPHLTIQTARPSEVSINRLFDKVYLLTLRSSLDRQQRFQRNIAPLGSFTYETFCGHFFNPKYGEVKDIMHKGVGYDFNKLKALVPNSYKSRKEGELQGMIAITLSHVEIIERAKAEGHRRVLIFEDDIAFAPTFLEYINKALRELDEKQPDWGFLYLGTPYWCCTKMAPEAEQTFEYVMKATNLINTAAFCVQERAFDDIIAWRDGWLSLEPTDEKIQSYFMPIDNMLGTVVQPNHPTFFVYPKIAYQDDYGVSTITS